jgi:hypothetical protein
MNSLVKSRQDSPSDENLSCLLNYMENAENEATLTTYVLSVITKALKRGHPTSELRSIPTAKWSDDYPLPLHKDDKYRISPPTPDETIGYNADPKSS